MDDSDRRDLIIILTVLVCRSVIDGYRKEIQHIAVQIFSEHTNSISVLNGVQQSTLNDEMSCAVEVATMGEIIGALGNWPFDLYLVDQRLIHWPRWFLTPWTWMWLKRNNEHRSRLLNNKCALYRYIVVMIVPIVLTSQNCNYCLIFLFIY